MQHLRRPQPHLQGTLARLIKLYCASLLRFLCQVLLLMAMDVESNPGPVGQPKNLSMVQMNVQSLYMTSRPNPSIKLDEIRSVYAIDKEIDIICVTETWLHDQSDSSKIEIQGYGKPYRRDRQGNRYGGVCAYVSENIVSRRLQHLEPPGIELLWLELKVQLKRVILGVCYRAPRQNQAEAEDFLEQLQASITNVIAHGGESIVILGDFNDTCTTWDSDHVTSELKNGLYDLVNMLDMVQLVDEPTYIKNNSANLLDLVITDSPGYVKNVTILPPLGSGHSVVELQFNITYPRDKSYVRHVWDYDKGDFNQLNTQIGRHPWDQILATDDLDSATTDWTDTFLHLCKESIPNRNIRVRPQDVPWMTHECKRAIRDRNRLYQRFKRTRNINHEDIWRNKAK